MLVKHSNSQAILSDTPHTPDRSLDRDEPDRPSKKQKTRVSSVIYSSAFIAKCDRLRGKTKKPDSKLRNLFNSQIMEVMWDLMDVLEERGMSHQEVYCPIN
jgi:hypothetical protein